MKSQVQVSFSDFFEKWLLQHEANLQQLLSVPRDPSHEPEHRALVSKVMNHYKEYYTAKWAGAHDDVLGFVSPPWFSPLENAYLWMTGWKPSLVYRLVDSLRHAQVPSASLTNLSEEQLKKIEELQLRTSKEEEVVEREMERQQVSIADRRMLDLARFASGVRNSEVVGEVDVLVETALKKLLAGLERVIKTADCVRLKALKGVMELLTPLQCVDFVAAASMLQIQVRRWGKRRDRHE